MNRFVGVDLGWYGKPSGLASLEWSGGELIQRKLDRLERPDEILGWIDSETGKGNAVVGVDAPLGDRKRNRYPARGARSQSRLPAFSRWMPSSESEPTLRPSRHRVQPSVGVPRLRTRHVNPAAAGRAFSSRSPPARRHDHPVRSRPDRQVQAWPAPTKSTGTASAARSDSQAPFCCRPDAPRTVAGRSTCWKHQAR